MFPNPQSALPLPPHPSSERYKKLAKELIRACRSSEREAIRTWAQTWVTSLVRLSALRIAPRQPVNVEEWIDLVETFARRKLHEGAHGDRTCSLADAQFVIARSHGFESWPKFTKHLQAVMRDDSPAHDSKRRPTPSPAATSRREAAVARRTGAGARAVPARARGDLLHYVSANGVEGFRQKTPPNIVAIAETLLLAGAEVDATASVYGSQCTTLGLAATSLHPEHAGVLAALLRTLLDHGAEIDRPGNAGGQRSLIAACLANGRKAAAEFLAGAGARLDFADAAGLGLLEVVQSFFRADGGSKRGITPAQLCEGFRFACMYGRNAVVEFLIARGVDLAAPDGAGQTGLHCAVIGGQVDTVALLLKHHAPLEAQNAHGGTPLGQAQWSAAHGGDPDRYGAILEALVRAGASHTRSS